ncbi:glycosyltransferase family 2 protein [Campylobacter upsaliensis]|uniref:glycosyltransferase family 2 protein n=2 Tax=Campylobacter upsaliensis TaxID=28080 RepID=UPI0013A903E2|nr:glycosyltransferase [Campylobacter upsaliensis]EDP6919041.1 glycosyltransferase [Campylobacter upsaliensis]MBJ6810051.1 glycosyltransferase [Campylobacter upsaliensis]
MINKKVGIVIPVYNVEFYLKECLEGVINQTYKNFTALLINDGSSDNSLEIAKEYAKKDERFIIISKENDGLSSARNVGIEFFEGKYHFKESESEEDLFKFCFNDELNPYKIHFLYQNKNKLNEEKIDYLIFLDSDDFWKLDCLEQCVKRMEGVDVLWFGVKPFYDGIKEGDWKSNLEWFDYDKELVISKRDWLRRIFEKKQHFFYFGWSGMINFHFLQKTKIKFINEAILYEDDYFGILLFLMADLIYICPQKLYIYRLRAGSAMNYTGENKRVAQYFRKQTEVFELEEDKRAYHVASSYARSTLGLEAFLQECDDEEAKFVISYCLMPTYTSSAFRILGFEKDPLGIMEQCVKLKKYMKDLSYFNFSLKEEMIYNIGREVLKDLKKFPNILKIPFKVCKMMTRYQVKQNIFKKNCERFDLLELYYNAKNDYINKMHLSYKLGVLFFKAYKYRYFGSFLFIPFALPFVIYSWSVARKKLSRGGGCNMLNANYPQTIMKQFYTNLNELGFGSEYRDIFYELSINKGLKCISTDIALSEILLDLGARVHHFEKNKKLKNILEKHFKGRENIQFHYKMLSNQNAILELPKYNYGKGFLPIDNHFKDSIECVDVNTLDEFEEELYLFYMELDFHNYKILEILETKKIKFIFLKVDAVFEKSEIFEKLEQKYYKMQFIKGL